MIESRIRSIFASSCLRAFAVFFFGVMTGCAGQRMAPVSTADLYYGRLYTEAREVVRPLAANRDSENVVLNNLRLGMSAFAWGDLDEAERAMLIAHEYLLSGQVNDPARRVAAEWVDEGKLVWKGEPYEQAMSYYYLASLYMVRGDFENARAAIRNALFKLRDIKDAGDKKKFDLIESEFVLGYVVLGMTQTLTGNPADAERPFARAVELAPDLQPLIQTLRENRYNTLLLVDYGRGPKKLATGADAQRVVFWPDGRDRPTPLVRFEVDGQTVTIPTDRPVVDLWRLSQFPKWWSLASWRQAKSDIGNFLLVAGAGAALGGAAADSNEAVYAGLGAAALGLLLKGTSKADTRHLGELPRVVFIVPIHLPPGKHDITIAVPGDPYGRAIWHDLIPGEPGKPAVYSIRQHDGNMAGQTWGNELRYTTDGSGRSYILGGRDFAWPTDPSLIEYFRAEGLLRQPGPQGLGDEAADRPKLFRHVALGGRVLDVPPRGFFGYEWLTRMNHPPYRPRTERIEQLQNSQAE